MAASMLLVGCGNMGHAMLSGWLSAGKLRAQNVAVVEPNQDLRSRAAGLGVVTFEDATRLPSGFDTRMVLFAVKPQVMPDVVPHYRSMAGSGTVFISVAAGTTIATIESLLRRRAAVLRCMPNTPASIGRGVMALHANAAVTDDMREAVRDLLSVSGVVVDITDEAQMDAVTAISGSGPAYVFHFIECLVAAGKAVGLPAETAKLLAIETVRGAAELAASSTEEPGRLREQVTSPNGTTAAALKVFMDEDRLAVLVKEAVEAAHRRSVELAG